MPLVLVAAAGGAQVVYAACRRAQGLGIAPGRPLAQAYAIAAGLCARPATPEADGRALAALAQWATRYTPWVAAEPGPAGAGGLMLDITGAAHLWGGEPALLADLLAALGAMGFEARAAAAATPGAAHAAARFLAGRRLPPPSPGAAPPLPDQTAAARSTTGQPAAARPMSTLPAAAVSIPAGAEAQALGPLPVGALRLPPGTAEALARVGLRRIADLTTQPRGPLAKRFGAAVLDRLDQALGAADEPIVPLPPLLAMSERLDFAEPLGRPESVAAALERLLVALCQRLEQRALGARRLELTAWRTDGSSATLAIGTARPERAPDHLARLFAEPLQRLDAGFGIEAMVLRARACDRQPAEQMASLHAGPGRAPAGPGGGTDAAAGERGRSFDRLVDRLANRLGETAVLRLTPHESHIPERAQRAVTAMTAPPAAAPMATRAVLPGTAAAQPGAAVRTPPRPVHLLATPEPIEAMAPVPDEPPVLFRWNRRTHRIRLAEGPERIGPEWWLDDPRLQTAQQDRARDYYRVEDTDGRRFWVFRDGPYRPGIAPRWFVHGVFA